MLAVRMAAAGVAPGESGSCQIRGCGSVFSLAKTLDGIPSTGRTGSQTPVKNPEDQVLSQVSRNGFPPWPASTGREETRESSPIFPQTSPTRSTPRPAEPCKPTAAIVSAKGLARFRSRFVLLTSGSRPRGRPYRNRTARRRKARWP
jgi:hypothetical protein